MVDTSTFYDPPVQLVDIKVGECTRVDLKNDKLELV